MRRILLGIVGVFGIAWQVGAAENCNQADTIYNRSLVEERKQEHLLREVMVICPSHVQAMNNLAVLAERQGNLQEAEGYYRKILKIQSDFAPAHAGLGDVLAAMGNFRGAAASYAVFLALLNAKANDGQTDNLAEHRPVYLAKLETVQRKINPDALVTTQEIANSLTAQTTTTQTKRGIRSVVTPPKVDLNIHFDTGSDLVQQRSMTQLEQVAAALTSPGLATARILIEGHTDADGSVEYNRDLSVRRAKKVQQTLAQKFHVSPDRFEVVGRGKEAPVANNNSPSGRALNRRVTFVNIGQDAR